MQQVNRNKVQDSRIESRQQGRSGLPCGRTGPRQARTGPRQARTGIGILQYYVEDAEDTANDGDMMNANWN